MAEAARRWVNRPEGSTWGDFGDDDALGRLNLITSAKVLEGLAEVTDGRAFPLGLPLDLPGGNSLNPNRLPPVLRPNLRNGQPNTNFIMDELSPGSTDVLNDDLVVLHTQYSTQWDALVHVGSMFDADGDGIPEPVYYNGFRADTDTSAPTEPDDCGIPHRAPDGPATNAYLQSTVDLGQLGVGSMAGHPVQGRAVLIDLAHHLGTSHQIVGYDQLSKVIAMDRIDIRPGDIVTVHTGFAQRLIRLAGQPKPHEWDRFGAVLDGRDPRLLKWVTDSQISAIAADNYAVELHPSPLDSGPGSILPLHEHCLFKLGVPLGELWHLSDLASALRSADRTAFLLTAPPLNLPGASASPLNPIATI